MPSGEIRETAEELYDRGVDLFAEGKYAEAVRAYEAAIEADPGLVDALHGLAMAHAENGDLEAAIRAAKRITEASPDDPLGFTSLSMFYQRAGRIAEAEAAANQARVLEWKAELKK
jgi:Flp pilus assembly protein TadD